MFKNNKQSGLAKLIILIIIAVLLLSYLGINIQKIAESETGKSNFAYLGGLLGQVWTYIMTLYQQTVGPFVLSFWDNIVVKQVWGNISNLTGKFF